MSSLFDFTRTVPEAEMAGLVVESKVPCRHCGGSLALNPHRMDASKVRVLMDLAILHRDGDAWVRIEAGRGLQGCKTLTWRATAYRANAHVERLAWFGLVEKRRKRSADVRLRPDGFLFLAGELELPAKILCRWGRVVFASRERIKIDQVRHVKLDKKYWDLYPWSDFVQGWEKRCL